MTQRLKTGKEFTFFLIKLAYGLVALPCLLIMGLLSLFAISGPGKTGSDIYIIVGTIWMGVIIPVAIFFWHVLKKRRLLKLVTKDIKDPDFFMPEPGYEMFHEGDGKYLGIDIKRGTLLYVHRIRKGEVDVVGLDMRDWINREVEGKMFRLYTKIPELPRIEIATPWAQRWFDTLGSMEFRQYQPAMPFSEYVDIHREQLERENNLVIPRLA